nr:hypothetical protein [Geodermatophilus sp. DF01_2]
MAGPCRRADVVPFGTAVRAWFLISLQTFGGPAGQIAVMQRTLVDEQRWTAQQAVEVYGWLGPREMSAGWRWPRPPPDR